jgi:hypothetical protein
MQEKIMFPVFQKLFSGQDKGYEFLKSLNLSYRYISVIKSNKRLYNPHIFELRLYAQKKGLEVSNSDFLWVDDVEPVKRGRPRKK